MKIYIAKRLCEGGATIWIVTLVVFALLRITGNPIDFLAPPDMPWTDRAYLREAYGLDKPLWQQYVLFNKSIITGISANHSVGHKAQPSTCCWNGCQPLYN